MEISQHLAFKQTQKLSLTPEIKHSMELLQLPILDLYSEIQNELLDNPFLETITENDKNNTNELNYIEKQRPNDTNRTGDDSYTNFYDIDTRSSYKKNEDASNKYNQFIESKISNETFSESLLNQLKLTDINLKEYKIAELLISLMDDRGFITETVDNIALDFNIKQSQIKKILFHIYRLEPIGLGTIDVYERLYIQSRILRPDYVDAHKVIKFHLKELERFEYKKIAKALRITESDVKQIAEFIKTLEPYPALNRSGKEANTYIVPDAYIREVDGNIEVIVNKEIIPELKINDMYKDMLRKTNSKDKEYITNKVESAKKFTRSIEYRNQTLEKVIRSIVDFQNDFFRSGIDYIKPLTLREIAEKLSLHESTISRATDNKYIQTGRGLFKLKWFFSSSVNSSSGSKVSSNRVQEIIKEIIHTEDKHNPLSDQEIGDLLISKEIEISRRTITKYRKQLKILPSNRRKKTDH